MKTKKYLTLGTFGMIFLFLGVIGAYAYPHPNNENLDIKNQEGHNMMDCQENNPTMMGTFDQEFTQQRNMMKTPMMKNEDSKMQQHMTIMHERGE